MGPRLRLNAGAVELSPPERENDRPYFLCGRPADWWRPPRLPSTRRFDGNHEANDFAVNCGSFCCFPLCFLPQIGVFFSTSDVKISVEGVDLPTSLEWSRMRVVGSSTADPSRRRITLSDWMLRCGPYQRWGCRASCSSNGLSFPMGLGRVPASETVADRGRGSVKSRCCYCCFQELEFLIMVVLICSFD